MLTFPGLKYFFLDCDGTMTDGKYFVSASGELFKGFHTRDFVALSFLQQAGVQVHIVTGSDDSCLEQKIIMLTCRDNLFIHHFSSKKICIEQFVFKWPHNYQSCDWEFSAYMGDCTNDLDCLKAARWVACPRDAVDEVKLIDGIYVADNRGGEGCVWDFVQHLSKL